MRPPQRLTLLLLLTLTCLHVAFGERTDVVLADGWRFRHEAIKPAADLSSWEQVSVPHCWNAFDGQDGNLGGTAAVSKNAWTPGEGVDLKSEAPRLQEDYRRGPGTYVREVVAPEAWRGRRVFLRCEAASTVARVSVNGIKLGEHFGGFTAFCFELTSALRIGGTNELRIEVDNSWREDLAPISGDFTVAGGLYRPVHLIVTDAVAISPLDHGSSGVYLSQRSLTDESAVVEARAIVSNGAAESRDVSIEVEIIDGEGRVVGRSSSALTLGAHTSRETSSLVTLKQPRRWNGVKDPHLYRTSVCLLQDGRVIDRVTEAFGLRTVSIDEEHGFLLNGEPYPVRGVNRHQEKRDLGWALSRADHERDFELIAELGATAVRLAHYPQAEDVYDIADRRGLLLWHEVSLVDAVTPTAAFLEHAESQVRELILQHHNNPSIAWVGLFNEIRSRTAKEAEPIVRRLRDVARELAPGQIIVAAPNILGQAINALPERLGYNIYPGWYGGEPSDLGKQVEARWKDAGGRRIALSEYGAGGNPDQHEEGLPKRPGHRSHWHPEEWQTYVHEEDWRQIRGNPRLWGSFVWVLFDFASDGRNEGAKPGINDKGLVTQDRSLRKDAFHFYQANWTRTPMVHIASRRMTPRTQSVTEVKAYSTCSSVELLVNGTSLGSATPDDLHIARWKDVRLAPGFNRIEVLGTESGTTVRDPCEWTLTAPSQSTSPQP